jgi:hypothetical protein
MLSHNLGVEEIEADYILTSFVYLFYNEDSCVHDPPLRKPQCSATGCNFIFIIVVAEVHSEIPLKFENFHLSPFYVYL